MKKFVDDVTNYVVAAEITFDKTLSDSLRNVFAIELEEALNKKYTSAEDAEYLNSQSEFYNYCDGEFEVNVSYFNERCVINSLPIMYDMQDSDIAEIIESAYRMIDTDAKILNVNIVKQ